MREDPGRSPMAVPENSLGFLLWQVSQSWRRHFAAGLARLELTDLEFCVLSGVRYLTEVDGAAPTQVAIAGYFNVNVMTISQLVRRLEERGLLLRRRHASDTRARALFLSPKGRSLLGEAFALAERSHETFFGMGDAEALWAALEPFYRATRGETEAALPPAAGLAS